MRKINYFLNLRVKLLFFVFTVAFVPLFIVTFISLRYSEQVTKSILYAHLHSLTQNKAKAISRWLSERITDVRVIADSKALKSMEAHEIESFLESMKSHYLDYRRIVLIDIRGRIKADTADRKGNYRKADWFQKTIEQGEYISDVFWESGELMFLIAVAVVKEKPVGVLCEFIGLQYLSEFASDMALGESGESYLVDKNGMIIAHKERQRILRDRIDNFDLLKNLAEYGTTPEVYRNYRNIEVLGVQTWVPRQGATGFLPVKWLLIAEQDTKEVFAKVNKYRVGIITLFFILFGTIISGCILIAHTIVHPVKELADATDAIAEGNFEKQLKIRRKDELGRLADAFNNMAQQLRTYYSSLENKITRTSEELEKISGELYKSKEALARSAKLVALGQVSAGMAHEIRTPLASIKLFIQSLEDELLSNDETKEDISIIKKEIDRMEEIINRFLDFARPVKPKFERVDVNQILSDTVTLIKTRIKDDKIAVETLYSDRLPLIDGDRNQLQQVFLNMLLNSIEAMPDGGKITIATNMINISNQHRKLLKITIADNGCGIDDATKNYIFDPFYTTKDSGTGMGLSISFTVIEQHGGLIDVESQPSKGAKFMIYLPINQGDKIGYDSNC